MGLIIAILVALGGLVALFHALVSVTWFTCIPTAPDLNLVSPQADLLIVFACLLAAWILGFFQRGIFAFRYVGTRFYGHEKTERGDIRTKWLVAGFPLLPIRSYLITSHLQEISNPEFEYEKNAMQPVEGYFHWPQMLRTALISYVTLIWCWGCLRLMFIGSCL